MFLLRLIILKVNLMSFVFTKFRSSVINFVNGGSVEESVLKIISPDYISESPLTFEGFWSLINNYRILNKIDSADYFTLLTPKETDRIGSVHFKAKIFLWTQMTGIFILKKNQNTELPFLLLKISSKQ
jgi:hypothetical protein